MRIFLFSVAIVAAFASVSCNNDAAPVALLCDTACNSDTIKFENSGPEKPYVRIAFADCSPDTIIWSHKGMESDRVMAFSDLVDENDLRLSKDNMNCYFKDDKYAWLEFNDCRNARGYLIRLTYSKDSSIAKYRSALTHFDPRYSIQDGLICYADYTFFYIEDIYTGAKAQVKMADKQLDIDYSDIHASYDSVNVTRNKVWLKLNDKGKELIVEKDISL